MYKPQLWDDAHLMIVYRTDAEPLLGQSTNGSVHSGVNKANSPFTIACPLLPVDSIVTSEKVPNCHGIATPDAAEAELVLTD